MISLQNIPQDLINFLLVSFLSLTIGLEQRRHHQDEKPESLYGTDRTYTLIGILGYVLYIISPANLLIFIAGGFGILALLLLFYLKRMEIRKQYGITSIIIVLITYNIAPLLYLKPIWLTILLVTTVLVLTEMKQQFRALSEKFDNNEFITLAKFLVIAGIILPLLPRYSISDFFPVSPFKIWLAVVVISGISYLSYIMRKFIFAKKGIILTGFLGGLYSSTATTIVLARKSKTIKNADGEIAAAILFSTGIMFIRIFVLAIIFIPKIVSNYALPFSILTILTFAVAFAIYKYGNKNFNIEVDDTKPRNPLEIKTALLFAILFVVFAVATKYVLELYGAKGLNILSIVVGVTDIDPFLLSLFTGHYSIDMETMTTATLIAISSNNVLKAIYSVIFGSKTIRNRVLLGFLIIIIATIIVIVI